MNSPFQQRVRFTVRGLLVLIALVASACFWITWPKRAALDFLVARHAKRMDVQNPYQAGTPEAVDFEKNRKPIIVRQRQKQKLNIEKLVPHKRTITDLLLSRQSFDFEMSCFTICRGKVVWGPRQFWSFPGGRSYR